MTWLLATLVVAAIGLSLAVRFAAVRPDPDFDPGSFRLDVLNGSGAPRMGRAVADVLSRRGFQVYRVGNADSLHERTKLIERRSTDGRNAARLADHLGVQHQLWVFAVGARRLPEVVVGIDSASFVDVSVVVGLDHELFFPGVVTLR